MTRWTTLRVSGETSSRSFSTRETVAIDTPARSAMSRMVTREATALDLLKHVPDRYGRVFRAPDSGMLESGLTFLSSVCNDPGNVFGPDRFMTLRPPPGEKGTESRCDAAPASKPRSQPPSPWDVSSPRCS